MSHTNTWWRRASTRATARHTYEEKGVPWLRTTGGRPGSPRLSQRTSPDVLRYVLVSCHSPTDSLLPCPPDDPAVSARERHLCRGGDLLPGRVVPQTLRGQAREHSLTEPVRLLQVRVAGEDELVDAEGVVLLDPLGDLVVAADQ